MSTPLNPKSVLTSHPVKFGGRPALHVVVQDLGKLTKDQFSTHLDRLADLIHCDRDTDSCEKQIIETNILDVTCTSYHI